MILIYKLDEDGRQKILAECRLENDKVSLSGEAEFIQKLERFGLRDRRANKILFPEDGEGFFKLLKSSFNSPYILAVEK